MHPLWPRVESCHPQLWRAVSGYELDVALREDLLQDVLVAIWESLPRLREPDRLLPFALRIAHNLGAGHARAAARVPRSVPLDEHLQLPDDSALNRQDDARSRWLFESLARLPVTQRQPLMLQLEGFDYREIADMLGISVDNVGVRIHRAREKLMVMARQEADDGPR
jgi:RNA polymerase sigma factor (sigma-70 family)